MRHQLNHQLTLPRSRSFLSKSKQSRELFQLKRMLRISKLLPNLLLKKLPMMKPKLRQWKKRPRKIRKVLKKNSPNLTKSTKCTSRSNSNVSINSTKIRKRPTRKIKRRLRNSNWKRIPPRSKRRRELPKLNLKKLPKLQQLIKQPKISKKQMKSQRRRLRSRLKKIKRLRKRRWRRTLLSLRRRPKRIRRRRWFNKSMIRRMLERSSNLHIRKNLRLKLLALRTLERHKLNWTNKLLINFHITWRARFLIRPPNRTF